MDPSISVPINLVQAITVSYLNYCFSFLSDLTAHCLAYCNTAAAAAAKSLQSCPTLCDPIDSSPPDSPSLGFSRQEHWSGLPFPSPLHASGKWKWSRSVVSDPQRPHGLQPTRLLRPWDFLGKSTGVGCHCLLRYCNTIPPKCESAHSYFPIQKSFVIPLLLGWNSKFLSFKKPYVSMPFSQIFPPSPCPTESIRLFYTSVSLLLSRIQGYCYHLSKFYIYALVYCIGVFLSGLLHSV